ncbi:MAG: FHA domain-containing protein [Deltaproteobacteria bacterium]|nr:FHA domain-containing protein [Deltaproteobacteria bacterium]
MATLLVEVLNLEGNARDTRAFPAALVRVGRNRVNDLVLPHPAISQFHCHLLVEGGAVLLVPGRATNAVTVNGREVAQGQRTPLDARAEVSLGPITLRCTLDPMDYQSPDVAPEWLSDRFSWAPDRKAPAIPETVTYNPAAMRAYAEALETSRGGAPAPTPSAPKVDPLVGVLERRRVASDEAAAIVRDRLDAALPSARSSLLRVLLTEHPELGALEPVRALGVEHGVTTEEALAEHSLLRLRQVAHRYGAAPPATAADVDDVVLRLAAALDGMADALIALRAVLEPRAFVEAAAHGGAGDGLRGDESAVLLRWLFAADAPIAAKVLGLRQLAAELAERPGQLTGAVIEGVRALLDRLSPYALEQELAAMRPGAALDAQAQAGLWQHWRSLFGWYAANGRELQATVFGRAFSESLLRDAGVRWEQG